MLARSPEPEAYNNVLDNNRDRIGIWKCWFLRRGENRSTQRKTCRSKEENQQQTQPTYDNSYDAGSGNRTRDTLVGGERSHHLAIPAPLCAIPAPAGEEGHAAPGNRMTRLTRCAITKWLGEISYREGLGVSPCIMGLITRPIYSLTSIKRPPSIKWPLSKVSIYLSVICCTATSIKRPRVFTSIKLPANYLSMRIGEIS